MKDLFQTFQMPKRAFMIALLFFLIWGGSKQIAQAQSDISNQFEWGQMIHGGGWVTGMNIHPSGDPIFCRADVSGAYRWDPVKSEWKCVVTQESLGNLVPWEYWGCASITSAPSDNNRAYMAFLNELYFSDNKGDNWTKATSLGVPVLEMGVNDRSGRNNGERLVVDPQNRDVVYFGSNQDGLLRSVDGGQNWTVISTPANNATSQGEFPGIMPVIDGNSPLINGRSSVVYFTNYNDGIYKSTDGGDSYSLINSTSGTDIEITDQGVLYVSANGSVLRYENNVFTQISPANQNWTDITVNGDQVWVIARGGYQFYYSANKGDNWIKINDAYSAVDVPWLPDGDNEWRSIGELEINRATGNLWMSEGVGVWHSSNPTSNTQTWESRTLGIGELVTFDIVMAANGQVAGVFADKAFIVTDNTGPAQDYYPDDFIAGWDLGGCYSQPNHIVVNIAPQPWNDQGDPPQLAYSSDNGQTFTNLNPPPIQSRQYRTTQGSKVEIASNDPDNLVWLNFTDHPEASRLYYTTNRGTSWQQSNASNGFVQGNEHSAASYLAADPNMPNTFYFHDASATFYRSTDGGANFVQMSTSTPPGGFHAEFKLIPGHEGHLIYTPGMASLNDAQLFLSEDRGATFSPVPNVTEVGQLAVGKAAPGAPYPTIFIIGKVNGVQGVYLSTDKMQSWQYMTNFPTGRSDLITELEGDMNNFGDLYGGFKSSGIFYAKYNSTPCTGYRTLTVENGLGSGAVCINEQASVIATVPECSAFLAWTGATQYLDDPSSPTAVVTMPDAAITLTATFTPLPDYQLNITNGTAGAAAACEGSIISIQANQAPPGKVFNSWTGDTQYLADPSSPATTVTMPASDVSLGVSYADFVRSYIDQSIPGIIEGEYFDNGGEGIAYHDDATRDGDLTFRSGETVDVAAKATASNGYSIGWSNPGEWVEYTLSSVSSGIYDMVLYYSSGATAQGDLRVSLNGTELTTFTDMSNTGAWDAFTTTTVPNISITAQSTNVLRFEYVGTVAGFDLDAVEFIPVNTPVLYNLSVNNGIGGGNFEAGAVISISANPPASGMVFDQWIGDIGNLENPGASTTTLTMSAADVAVEATYQNAPTGGQTLTLTPIHDATTEEGLPSNNTGAYPYVEVRQHGYGWSKDGNLMFDLSGVGGVITDARIRLNITDITNAGSVALQPVADDTWSESTINYNNQPAASAVIASQNISSLGWVEIDVTALAESERADGKLSVRLVGEAADTRFRCSSKEGSTPPELIISTSSSGLSTYNLTVNSGIGDGAYEAGTVVAIVAASAPTGQEFDQWTGDVTTISDISSATTNLTMPAADIAISASYKPVTTQSPYNGAPAIIPGIFEAENYDLGGSGIAYFDTDATNNGGFYRTDEVDIQQSNEGGYHIGWAEQNEWLEYTVDVQAGADYRVIARVASADSDGNSGFTVSSDSGGSVSFNVGSTGGWQSFTNIERTIALNAGEQILRIDITEDGVNIKSLEFIEVSSPDTYSLSVVNGSGGGSYEANTSVNIVADAPPAGQVFDQWSGDVAAIVDPFSASTTLLMPASNLSVTALYQPIGGCGVTMPGSFAVEYCDLADGATFQVGNPISIKANATSDIVKVQAFYNGWNWIGESTSAPYEIVWNNAPSGTHTVSIRGVDGSGSRTPLSSITIHVLSPRPGSPSPGTTEKEVNIYPNPVRSGGDLIISDLPSASHHYMVFDFNGRIVANVNILEGTGAMTFNTLNLNPGVYSVVIYTNEGLVAKRVVIF